MPSIESAPVTSAADFRARLLRFVNHTLPRLDRRERTWPPIAADTPLFASGLLDSLSILHLLAAVETLRGESVPDSLVLMKHFQTVEAITATFGPAAEGAAA